MSHHSLREPLGRQLRSGYRMLAKPLAQLLTYLIEHDSYHAGQVELLRQLRGYPRVED